jgi:acetylornithine deacetylase/succinyl-diaminopimelate desuccinylase-like protein
VRAGSKINVRPTSATVDLDGRVLPGFGADAFVAELRRLLGDDIELEVLRFDPVSAAVDLGLFPLLSEVLRSGDASLRPIPMLLPAATDGRHFSRLGIQSYGFTPMTLPRELAFTRLIHAADERIPVGALAFGTACFSAVLERYGR